MLLGLSSGPLAPIQVLFLKEMKHSLEKHSWHFFRFVEGGVSDSGGGLFITVVGMGVSTQVLDLDVSIFCFVK